jgi:hypothetical protein
MKDYQYIGTNYNLEPGCIDEMNLEKEEATEADIIAKMDIETRDVALMFPRMKHGRFYTGVFDNVPCIIYETDIYHEQSEWRTLQFVWIDLG